MSIIALTLSSQALLSPPQFTDVTAAVGLGPDIVPEVVARACFADLNGDNWPDAVIDRHRVFLSVADDDSPLGRRFEEVPPDRTGLLPSQQGTVTVFADLDNDGHLDAVVAEFVDLENPDWTDHGRRTGWHRGGGDGMFAEREPLPVPARTTISIAVGDVNRDGRLDLYFGNTYQRYGHSFEAFPNDLLRSEGSAGWKREPLPEEDHEFSETDDLAGRPTFGTMILNNPIGAGMMLLELSYGRRWNRTWVRDAGGAWRDVAPELGLDGDSIRHGRHPAWLKERAKTDSRFDRDDEKPFRANGNTFDAAVGDVDRDGRFDLFVSEITHGWAGDSSDRSRFLFNRGDRFVTDPSFNVDRVPPVPDDPAEPHNWNHGDLFAELADLDHDGRLDLVLASGDYPDDQRLRVYRTTASGVQSVTEPWGIDHDGAQQISLGDIDGDGALDLIVGQTFNRFTPAQREGRSPHLRVLHNRATGERPALSLHLAGDGQTANRQAIGAMVTIQADGRTQVRQLVGPGGHAGKQHASTIHFGLGDVERIERLEITWPDANQTIQTFENVQPGRYVLNQGEELERLSP